MSDNPDILFREVDEEVRRDQLLALWKRYGGALIAAGLLVIAIVVGYQLWNSAKESALREDAERFAALIERANDTEAEAAASAFSAGIEELGGGYKDLASLRRAASLRQAGDFAAAAAAYKAVASSADDDRLSDFAAYLGASAQFETGDLDGANAALQSLSLPGRPLRYSAMELLAVISAVQGDLETARSHLGAIVEDPAAPPNMKTRAEELLTLYGADGDAAPVLQEEGA